MKILIKSFYYESEIFISPHANPFILFFNSCEKKLPEEFSQVELGDTEIIEIYSTSSIITTELINRSPLIFEQHGHCWSVNPNPDVDDSTTRLKRIMEPRIFESHLQNLLPNTKYYVRPYMTCDGGTYYGQEYTFNTEAIGAPFVVVKMCINNTTSSVKAIADATDNGGAVITEKGFLWGLKNEISLSDCIGSKIIGEGLGEYESTIKNLLDNTQYYIKAFAKNEHGTRYSEAFIVLTIEAHFPSAITYNPVIQSPTSVLLKGFIDNDGGSPIVERGFVVNKSGFPTIENSLYNIQNGSEIGFFSNEIDGLEQSEGYFYRSYAINTKGVGYGNQKNFILNPENTPRVTTMFVYEIQFENAKCGGSVLDDYGSQETMRGCVWNLTGNPTLENCIGYTNNSDTLENLSFYSYISNLEQLTTYFIRAYAVNEYGEGYGSEFEFTTKGDYCEGVEELTIEGESYPVGILGKQCWMLKNLNAGIMIHSNESATNNLVVEKYCYNNILENCDSISGGLYFWDEMMNYSNSQLSQGICPNGWHIPSDIEWIELEGFSDSYMDIDNPDWLNFGWRGFDAGKYLKKFGAWGTQSEDAGGSFDAIPSGYMTSDSDFLGDGINTKFWTTSTTDDILHITRELRGSSKSVRRVSYDVKLAVAVRCIKD